MLTNIENIHIVAVIAAAFVTGLMLCIQWSLFEDHRKAHFDDADEHAVKLASSFAVVPYLLIPAVFVALSVVIGIFTADYLASCNYVSGQSGICLVATAVSIAAYAILDHTVVGHLGDAVYFRTIESRIVETVTVKWDDLTDEEKDAAIKAATRKKR